MIHHPHTHGIVFLAHLPKIIVFVLLDVVVSIMIHQLLDDVNGRWIIMGGVVAFILFYAVLCFYTGRLMKDPDSVLSKELVLTDSSAKVEDTWSQYVGKLGVAKTACRPTGTVVVDGESLSVVTDGEFLEPGTSVEVTEATGMRIVVRSAPEGESSD